MEYSAWSVAHGVQRMECSAWSTAPYTLPTCLLGSCWRSFRKVNVLLFLPSRTPNDCEVNAPRIMACGNAAKRQRFGAKLRCKSIRKRSFTSQSCEVLLGKYGLPKPKNPTTNQGHPKSPKSWILTVCGKS